MIAWLWAIYNGPSRMIIIPVDVVIGFALLVYWLVIWRCIKWWSRLP